MTANKLPYTQNENIMSILNIYNAGSNVIDIGNMYDKTNPFGKMFSPYSTIRPWHTVGDIAKIYKSGKSLSHMLTFFLTVGLSPEHFSGDMPRNITDYRRLDSSIAMSIVFDMLKTRIDKIPEAKELLVDNLHTKIVCERVNTYQVWNSPVKKSTPIQLYKPYVDMLKVLSTMLNDGTFDDEKEISVIRKAFAIDTGADGISDDLKNNIIANLTA